MPPVGRSQSEATPGRAPLVKGAREWTGVPTEHARREWKPALLQGTGAYSARHYTAALAGLERLPRTSTSILAGFSPRRTRCEVRDRLMHAWFSWRRRPRFQERKGGGRKRKKAGFISSAVMLAFPDTATRPYRVRHWKPGRPQVESQQAARQNLPDTSSASAL